MSRRLWRVFLGGEGGTELGGWARENVYRTDDPGVLEAFLRTNHFNGVQGRLTQAADYYRAGQIYPLSYLISRDGHVIKRWSGRPAENRLRASIREEL